MINRTKDDIKKERKELMTKLASLYREYASYYSDMEALCIGQASDCPPSQEDFTREGVALQDTNAILSARKEEMFAAVARNATELFYSDKD